MKPDIKSLTRQELAAQVRAWDYPDFRVTQILQWLYRRRVECWDAMSNLPKPLRQHLADNYSLHTLKLKLEQTASDGTRKFLWQLYDGAFIESVLVPATRSMYGASSSRLTLCVSTQVGCAYGCKFCASGLNGWKRNLWPSEIVEQTVAVERLHSASGAGQRLVDNLVIMGMGEPLANYDALLQALKILNATWGCMIGARKITVSTCGLVPQIRRLATEPMQLRLAISLHGATDEVRNKLMPVNRKYPLSELVQACEYYTSQKAKMISLEYMLISGVNDDLNQVKPLAQLARRLRAKINLIPYNSVQGLSWTRPSEDVQTAFFARLKRLKADATLRREKGHDIDAACGQLRLRTEQHRRLSSLAN